MNFLRKTRAQKLAEALLDERPDLYFVGGQRAGKSLIAGVVWAQALHNECMKSNRLLKFLKEE
jgi:hypothetical protein